MYNVKQFYDIKYQGDFVFFNHMWYGLDSQKKEIPNVRYEKLDHHFVIFVFLLVLLEFLVLLITKKPVLRHGNNSKATKHIDKSEELFCFGPDALRHSLSIGEISLTNLLHRCFLSEVWIVLWVIPLHVHPGSATYRHE